MARGRAYRCRRHRGCRRVTMALVNGPRLRWSVLGRIWPILGARRGRMAGYSGTLGAKSHKNAGTVLGSPHAWTADTRADASGGGM